MSDPFIPPQQDPVFRFDSVIEVENPHTTFWRADKNGQMRKVQFPPYRYQEFPKMLYGIGVEPLIVEDPEEEEHFYKLGYRDHPDKIADLRAEVEAEGRTYAVQAVTGEQKPPPAPSRAARSAAASKAARARWAAKHPPEQT